MRKTLLTAFAALAITTTFALADADVMASRYGNTTISTDAQGRQTKVYYNADHTFTWKSGDASGKGTWKVENGKICLTYEGTVPAGITNPFCAPVVERKVGESWSVGEGANKRTVTVVQGIQ